MQAEITELMSNVTTIEIGRVAGLFRYPVKSMLGASLESVALGWHGFAGDRRFAFRRMTDKVGFPWLNANRLPVLSLYQPILQGDVPTHVLTPDGATLEIYSEELRQELSARFGKEVEMLQIDRGIFDEATVSVISTSTIRGLAQTLEKEIDERRFRPNILLETTQTEIFGEDEWVGGTLIFGEEDLGPAVSITLRDLRCNTINLNPDTAQQDPSVLKAVGQLNKGNAGVYGTVVRTGTLAVGQKVWLHRTTEK